MQSLIRAELLKVPRDFADHWQAIQDLRVALGVCDDVLLDPIHFLGSTDSRRHPCSVACWRGEELIGIAYLTEHCVKSIRTGYAIGGDFVGRGLLLCSAEDEPVVLKRSVGALLAGGIHSLHLRFLPRTEISLDVPGFQQTVLEKTIPGDRLTLQATFDEFLATLGKHTRRNIRNFMRKAEDAGIQFAPQISAEEYKGAVSRLNVSPVFHANPMRLERDERLLGLHSGAKRVGLRNADAQLVAILCGFSRGRSFHLLTQLNDHRLEFLSLSMVLRGQLIKHLIASGHTELQFMGGASLAIARFCHPLNYRAIILDKQQGISAVTKRLGNILVKVMASARKPIPERLALMCSGHLERPMLIRRTAVGMGCTEGELHKA